MKIKKFNENNNNFTINDIRRYNSLLEDVYLYVEKNLNNRDKNFDWFIIESINIDNDPMEINYVTYKDGFKNREEVFQGMLRVDFNEMLDEISVIKDAKKYNL